MKQHCDLSHWDFCEFWVITPITWYLRIRIKVRSVMLNSTIYFLVIIEEILTDKFVYWQANMHSKQETYDLFWVFLLTLWTKNLQCTFTLVIRPSRWFNYITVARKPFLEEQFSATIPGIYNHRHEYSSCTRSKKAAWPIVADHEICC